MGDGGNLSRDLGSDVALTASIAALVPKSQEDASEAMLRGEVLEGRRGCRTVGEVA